MPYSGINLAYSPPRGRTWGCRDLREPHSGPSADRRLRTRPAWQAHRALPLHELRVPAADMVSQILNFGLRLRSTCRYRLQRRGQPRLRQRLLARMHGIRGSRFAHSTGVRLPTLNVEVDRSKAALLGLSETDVASNLLVSLSGSSQPRSPSGSTRRAAPSTASRPDAAVPAGLTLDLAATPVTGTVSASGATPLPARQRPAQRWPRRAAARQPCELSARRGAGSREPLRRHSGG